MNTAVQLNYNFNRAHRVLACRAHVKAFYYFLTGVASLWLLLGLATLATFGLTENSSGVFWSAIFGFVLPTGLLVLARFLIRPVAFTRAELKPDSLIIRKDDREYDLSFKDVEEVKLNHVPFIAGWMTIVMKDGKTYLLSVALERSEYVLDALMQFNPKLANAEKVHNYRLTAIYYDHSWARLVDRLNNRRKLGVKYLLGAFVLPIVYHVAVLSQHNEVKPNIYQLILLTVGSFVFLILLGGTLWFLTEMLVLSPMSRVTLKQDASRPVRPVEFEKRVELLSDLAYVGIVIGCLVLLT